MPGKAANLGRDDEHARQGTVSILAGIDLHFGHIFERVEDRHRGAEFIELLKDIDAYYPPEAIIRLILDNHSAHLSKETRAFLATRPGRFEYVHTPKHGSVAQPHRVRLLEDGSLIRVTKIRIRQGINEMNAAPVVFRWKKPDLAMA